MKNEKNITERKLEKCIEFIEKLEHMDIPYETIEDDQYGREFVQAKFVEQIKDSAWHLLADLV